MSALQVQGLVKRFGGLLATDHFELDLQPGELHALIGPNGAGKTTLINQLAGELAPSEGRILLDGQDITHRPVPWRARNGLARSFQITSVCPAFTVLQNVMLGVQGATGDSWGFWQATRQDPRLVEPAMHWLQEVGLADQAQRRVATLAHGACRQLELAITLALQPRVLLLDEPMAGMSHEESQDMVALLQRLKGRYSVLLVEHDMDAVFALADRITVMVYGRAIFCGSADEVRRHPEVRKAYLGEETTTAETA